MPAGQRRKPPTDHGATKLLPPKQLQSILEHFVAVLETEQNLLFSHHLGVHSGTAVMEDLLARKLWELCNKAHALITMKDNCMDTFLRFCENLSTGKRNRLLTAFSVFDKGDLLDYVQLVKPHLLQDSTTQSLVSTEQSFKSLRPSATGNRNTGSGEVTKPGALRSMQLAPFVSRVEALRKAGHPFLKIVDKIIDDKHLHPAPTIDAETDANSVAGALRDGVVTEGFAAQVHRMLKTDLTARRKWLGGMPLHLALLESSSPPRSGRSMLSGTPRTQTPPISEHQEWPGCGAAEMNIMCLEPS